MTTREMTLADVDLWSPDVYVSGVPHDMYRVLRREAPVFRHPEPDGPGFWALTKYDDVVTVSKGTLDWSRPSTWTGVIDRSPCGTGTCAKMAVLHAILKGSV